MDQSSQLIKEQYLGIRNRFLPSMERGGRATQDLWPCAIYLDFHDAMACIVHLHKYQSIHFNVRFDRIN